MQKLVQETFDGSSSFLVFSHPVEIRKTDHIIFSFGESDDKFYDMELILKNATGGQDMVVFTAGHDNTTYEFDIRERVKEFKGDSILTSGLVLAGGLKKVKVTISRPSQN